MEEYRCADDHPDLKSSPACYWKRAETMSKDAAFFPIFASSAIPYTRLHQFMGCTPIRKVWGQASATTGRGRLNTTKFRARVLPAAREASIQPHVCGGDLPHSRSRQSRGALHSRKERNCTMTYWTRWI